MIANKSIIKTLFFLIIICLSFFIFAARANAKILDSWQNNDAYKPNPILFLHGFALGNASSWNKVVNGDKDFEGLKGYFSKYTQKSSNIDSSIPYLERINFYDHNGSIDTYDPDKTNPLGDHKGWADKLSERVDVLLSTYVFGDISLKKINLICHSMGGLAAREYVANPKYNNGSLSIDKIITIGTPHAGTPLASAKKMENAMLGISKYVWEVPWFGKTRTILEVTESHHIIKDLKGQYAIDFDGEAIKDMAIGSEFLMTLKGYPWPANTKKFAGYGKATTELAERLNKMFFSSYYPGEPFTPGDGIVPRDSQIGYDILTEYPYRSYWVWEPDKVIDINGDHFTELNSSETPQKLLSFLDSTKPELAITFPDPNVTTEIHSTSINIQGTVSKEYLPADTTLTITVTKQEDRSSFSLPDSLLEPSSLWSPNNPD
ncbi:MAG: alpha/beta hydrolase, partial [bacterium]|nr:alpha/beta hydrolase [bacterium]